MLNPQRYCHQSLENSIFSNALYRELTPCWSSAQDPVLSLPRTQVQSLVRELRYHKACSVAERRDKLPTMIKCSTRTLYKQMDTRVTCGPSTVRWHVTTCGGAQSPALKDHREGHRRHPSQAEPTGTLAPLARDPTSIRELFRFGSRRWFHPHSPPYTAFPNGGSPLPTSLFSPLHL